MAKCRCGAYREFTQVECPACTRLSQERDIQDARSLFSDLFPQRANETALAQQALEVVRINELKKNNQILIEQTIHPSEAYKHGYDCKDVSEFYIDDKGAFTFTHNDPYILPKLKEQYIQGVFDKLKNDPSPGPRFTSEAAFNAGYCREHQPEIVYTLNADEYHLAPQYKNIIKPIVFSIDKETGAAKLKSTNFPFNSQLLNTAYQNGLNKYLDEINTEELKLSRKTDILNKEKIQIENEVQAKLERKKVMAIKIATALMAILVCISEYFINGLSYFFALGVSSFFVLRWINKYEGFDIPFLGTIPFFVLAGFLIYLLKPIAFNFNGINVVAPSVNSAVLSSQGGPVEMSTEQLCNYFKGEPAYDAERRTFLEAKIKEFCKE